MMRTFSGFGDLEFRDPDCSPGNQLIELTGNPQISPAARARALLTIRVTVAVFP